MDYVETELEALLAEARDPETSFKRLEELIKHPEVEVRRAVLDNPNLCPDQGQLDVSLLEELAKEFPKEVATHPVFVLHALIEPTNEMLWVVEEVVERTEDVGLIEHAFRTWGQSWISVRESVASNPRAPEDVLRTLGNEATESDEYVRKAVAKNPSAPEDVLRLLGNEKTESHRLVRESVAKNSNTPVEILRLLGNKATESNWGVRQVVASNPSTPEDLLRSLGNEQTESDFNVRQAVTLNPRTPVGVLRILGNPETESHGWVRQSAQKALAARGLT